MTRRQLPSVLDLSRAQFDGRACVWCSTPLWRNAVSAGRATGRLGEHDLDIEVYACAACAIAPQSSAHAGHLRRGREDGRRPGKGRPS